MKKAFVKALKDYWGAQNVKVQLKAWAKLETAIDQMGAEKAEMLYQEAKSEYLV